ncbi:lecithin retinol acyltransferase [Corythoichthys intestinalis]|uniref:lecithin retinol acyltransferase n=1 Tax=Corythoichthys intestinalis TaxID=161448 RepID=UPI0025A62F1E|nr:lecithin retinol acyltransferase b, tandem duplicate 2 [Corythoichthys intestinalis]XP_061792303.1 lecithin retinol acyltransferase-like [Nerophis lumbriciformis]
MFLYQLLSFFFAGGGEKKEEPSSGYEASRFKRGDLLEVPRTLFTHFGIYLGEGRVAHLIPDILPALTRDRAAVGEAVTNRRLILGVVAKVASVRVDSLRDFAYGSPVLVNRTDDVCKQPPLDGERVAERAEKLLGAVAYSLLWYNCEHYVMYCRYGMAISYQTYQFCTTVRKIVCSRTSSYLTALCGAAFLLFLGCATPAPLLATLLLSFTIWMAA